MAGVDAKNAALHNEACACFEERGTAARLAGSAVSQERLLHTLSFEEARSRRSKELTERPVQDSEVP